MQPMRVGLLGMGTVGRGTWDVLNRNAEEIARRAGRPIRINWIATRTLERARSALGAAKNAQLTTELAAVVAHPEVDIVVELIGGIEPAKSLVLAAISHRKHVVTANKALLAAHGNEIFAAAQQGRRHGRFRSRGRRRHSDHQGVARRPHRKSHRVDRRHHQRHQQLHPFGNAGDWRVVRRRAGRGPEARLRRSRPDVRHRGHRRRAQAHHHVRDRLRRADAARQGVHRGHLPPDARRHPLRGRAWLSDQVARHHAPHDERGPRRHRVARAPDIGSRKEA